MPRRDRRVVPAPVRWPGARGLRLGRRRLREGLRRDVGPVRRHRHLRRHDLHRHRRHPGRALRRDGRARGRSGSEPACDDAATTDAEMATPEDMDATLAAASALPTYATAWLSNGTDQRRGHRGPRGRRGRAPQDLGRAALRDHRREDRRRPQRGQPGAPGGARRPAADQRVHRARLARRAGRLRRRVDPGLGRRDVRRGPGAGQLGARCQWAECARGSGPTGVRTRPRARTSP